MDLTNATIAGNTAEAGTGGAGGAAGTGRINGSPGSAGAAGASALGGGVFSSGTVNATNALIAINIAATNPDFSGNFNAASHNLLGNNSGSNLAAANPDANGNIVGSSTSPINPMLGALANNGGPTLTCALLAGSPAINAGTTGTGVSTDERGVLRDSTPDIGAFEFTPVSATLTSGNLIVNGTTGSDTISVDPVSGGPTTFQVTGDGIVVGTFSVSAITGQIKVYGNGGNDSLSINPSVTLPALLTGGTGNDTLTAGGGNDTLVGGGGNDQFIVSNATGTDTLNATGGKGTLIASGDANYTLTNAKLTRSTGGTFTLLNIKNAVLTGGAGNDTFTVSGWTHSASLNGGGGTATVVDVRNAPSFTLTDSSLSVAGAGTFTLSGIKQAILIGGTNTTAINAAGFSGTTVLDGNGGKATLTGGSGRNILIGGAGRATLIGGSADDILIGDRTSYDKGTSANITALEAIMAEWASSDSYATRISDIMGPTGGLNGNNFLNSTTVFNAHVADSLTGGAGLDWFIISSGDTITDLNNGGTETVTTI
jgi:hypothetical protein